ncbi:MAG: beta-ketoacyl-ACP synthase II [Treponema sp.]|uniref:beta-ketoacyl-ACP synthase II n=1 Tax=Treponema sp. TaxID=166 RepID=UPI001D5EA342|nr:beta-ketoacyl-ACP synthase II [Treponema sp.]MBS7310689.1 beta-ketoacyl-ACP synthase II [Treponema sp.]MCI5696335.1 beta-ketoacyl-ACP synthase II [Spirochaetia bacterium]MDD5812419.1 beta-ketoacyl-ACP synthase II [Treponema sp.]MDY5885163.1 beta-ketoacyl-ACP synthase II [Treponema sp.]
MRRVVITGMGAITPLGNSVDEFWSGIKAGKSGIGPITQFDASINKVHYAAEVKNFNPGDYMDPKDARKMARFTQFGVAAAKQCIEDAGLMGNSEVLDETGIILGVGIGGLEVTESSVLSMQKMGFVKTNPMAIPELIPNEVGGNIAINFGLHGPVQSIATACSSGSDAMGVAFDMVRSGRLDTCLTGGSEATICQFGVVSFEVLHALSTGFDDDPTKASRPFDKNRNGFVMGEGSGMLMFEEYEHAKARGAKIYAEVAGYGASCDGFHLTAPNPDGIFGSKCMTRALKDANMDPSEIQYYNAHGTSTHKNDSAETQMIKIAFGEENARKLKISSTKSMHGHCLGATGAIESIVCVKAITDSYYPMTKNLDEQDIEGGCDLDYCANKGIEGNIDAAMSCTFGFGGHNGCLIFKKIKD